MGPDSSNQPTPPDLPTIPAAQPMWPSPQRDRPPSHRPPWALFAIIGTVVIVALLAGLLLLLHAVSTPSTVVPPASLTASTGIGTQSPDTSATATPTTQATTAPSDTATATTPLQPPTVHFVSNQASVSSGTPVEVNCPSGEVALSGGWAIGGARNTVSNSSRSDNGWHVFPEGSSVQTTVYVMCLQNDPSASVVERSTQVTVNPGSEGGVIVPCNAGEVPVGGGFANPDAPTTSVYNLQYISHGWGGDAYNDSSSAHPVTFYAECLTAPRAHVELTSSATTTVAPGTSGGTEVSCPAGALLSGGGFLGDKYTFAYDSLPANASTWETDITNETPSDYNELYAYAMCLSLG